MTQLQEISSEIIETFVLKDTREVIIKHIEIEDYEKNNNFEFYYTWRAQVDTFMIFL